MIEKLGPATGFGVPRAFAFFYVIAGETEKAADWRERAIEQRDGAFSFITAVPLWKPLRESPRWPKLARMMNLPDCI